MTPDAAPSSFTVAPETGNPDPGSATIPTIAFPEAGAANATRCVENANATIANAASERAPKGKSYEKLLENGTRKIRLREMVLKKEV
jgi:hypothetical protein